MEILTVKLTKRLYDQLFTKDTPKEYEIVKVTESPYWEDPRWRAQQKVATKAWDRLKEIEFKIKHDIK